MANDPASQQEAPPDQFLYGRKGPWPQPSPSHPLQEAAEVLNIPPIESLVWNGTVGKRLLEILGKDPSGPGVIQPAEMSGAMAAIRAAVAQDEAKREAQKTRDVGDEDDEGPRQN